MTGDWSEIMLLRTVDFRKLESAHPELMQRVAFLSRGKEAKEDVLSAHEHQLRLEQEGWLHHSHDHHSRSHHFTHGVGTILAGMTGHGHAQEGGSPSFQGKSKKITLASV